MLILDTSALISLALVNEVETVCSEFEVHTTEPVIRELERISREDDSLAEAASTALGSDITVHDVAGSRFESSRIDPGEASCAELTRDVDADFLVTDDVRALAELRAVSLAEVVISPVVLRALVERGLLESKEAGEKVEKLAERRDWMGTPIYRRARGRLGLN
ncbi:MAG: hypothetical protein SVW02_03750 [Candidatus Nanohaloarchaea archaeon]|nr:hypothetical protein [Candidatus Nanohaloarchaea archaeon]